MIPKPGTRKRRRLGIPTVADRVVQASLKLVLEPIFEADFLPCSYGFRPGGGRTTRWPRSASSASRTYEWVLEGDIKACFDEISHPALMDRVRARIADKRVLALVKAFLKAGILTEDGGPGTPAPAPRKAAILTPPTQWITRAMVTLRVRLVSSWPRAVERSARVGMRCRMVIFSGPMRTSLTSSRSTRWRSSTVAVAALRVQLGEEAFEVVGELEVGLAVGELGVEGVDLAAQVRLAGAQVRHPGAQFVDGDQLLGEGLDHGG